MYFDSRKMRLTTVLIFAFICMATLYVTTADDLLCMCNCCVGSGCKAKWLDPMFPIDPQCTTEACIAACPGKFPDQCGQDHSVVDGMCMSGGASHTFNQYTTMGALILAFITTTIFRI